MAIGIALLGAGIFALNEHLPAIDSSDALELKAVYSRSQATAEAFVAKSGKTDLPAYYDVPATPGKGLADLLARTDIAAVSVCMPINLQPAAIRAALDAGKHVISEKPVADTVANARELVAYYQSLPSPPLWGVAENYRYQASLLLAADEVKKLGGSLVSFALNSCKFVRPDGNYFNTAWRKNPTHPGGFLLDGGIHNIASLRLLLAAAPLSKGGKSNKIAQVAGTMEQLLEILPPADTVRAIAVTEGGASGVVTMSFGTEFGVPLEISITTTEGMVTWTPKKVTVVTRNDADLAAPHVAEHDCSPANTAFPADEGTGVKAEFRAFAASLQRGTMDAGLSPIEALADLELLEAMFDSGAAVLAPKTI